MLVIALAQMPLVAQTVQCIALSDVPNERGIPIPDERIVRVPEQQQANASTFLGENTFVQLSWAQVEELLGTSAINGKEALAREAQQADAKAGACRQLAAEPFFARDKERDLKAAESYDKYAAYLRALQPQALLPYLVNSKVYSEGTGAYWASFKGHHLSFAHGSLGRGPMKVKRVAVVVFVESQIDYVAISVSAAE